MHDSTGVRCCEAARDLGRDFQGLERLQPALPRSLLEINPVIAGHYNENLAVGSFLHGMNGANVRMIERRRSSRLTQETVALDSARLKVMRKEFQSDCAFQFGVVRAIDNPHPASAKFAGDAVVQNGVPGGPERQVWWHKQSGGV